MGDTIEVQDNEGNWHSLDKNLASAGMNMEALSIRPDMEAYTDLSTMRRHQAVFDLMIEMASMDELRKLYGIYTLRSLTSALPNLSPHSKLIAIYTGY